MNRAGGIRIALALIFTAALFSTACYEFSPGNFRDEVHKSFQVQPGGKLSLDTDAGSVEISSGSTNAVHVNVARESRGNTNEEAEQELRQLRLDFRQDGNDIYIQARWPEDHFWGFNRRNERRLRFEIIVPGKYNLDLKTGGGNISINDLEGTVAARTSGGNLQFGRINGVVNARTSGGNISLEACSGPLDVDTSGGNIRIGKVNGSVKAQTSGGNIAVEEVQSRIQASTSGGNVDATITKQPDGDCELNSSGGFIRARLRRDLNLNLEAKTDGGSVRANIPITVQGEMNPGRLEGKINHGGPKLLLHTSGGNISIDETP
jgi:DUF4097 and DUF4098 domain-containing protein YvlB